MNTKDPDLVIRAMARMYLKIDGQHQTITGQLRTIAKQEKEIASLRERLGLRPGEVSQGLENAGLRRELEQVKSIVTDEEAERARRYGECQSERKRLRQECRLKDKQIEDLKRRLQLRPDEVSQDLEIVRLRKRVETQKETIGRLQRQDSRWIAKVEELVEKNTHLEDKLRRIAISELP